MTQEKKLAQALRYLKKRGIYACDRNSKFQYRDKDGQLRPRPRWLFRPGQAG